MSEHDEGPIAWEQIRPLRPPVGNHRDIMSSPTRLRKGLLACRRSARDRTHQRHGCRGLDDPPSSAPESLGCEHMILILGAE